MYLKALLPVALAAFAIAACADVSPTGPEPAPAVTPSLNEELAVAEPSVCGELTALRDAGQISQDDYAGVCGTGGLPLDPSNPACAGGLFNALVPEKFGLYLKLCGFPFP